MLLRTTRPCTISTWDGARALPPLPLFFAADQSFAPPPGFEAWLVEDVDWLSLPLLDTPSSSSGTLLVPARASSWLSLDRDRAPEFAPLRDAMAKLRSSTPKWRLPSGARSLTPALVMGILNITPDSFSDGGHFLDPDKAFSQAKALVQAGADILDVGAESSRPGATPVSAEEELARLLPLISRLKTLKVPISVDTYKARVAREVLSAGAEIINDIGALNDPEMVDVIKEADAGLVLMHMRGEPRTMQKNTHYEDLEVEVLTYLESSLRRAFLAGIDLRNVVVDPGIGFGKDLPHNLRLLGAANWLWSLGRPTLLGPSRKRFLGEITGKKVEERHDATVAALTLGALEGAHILRAHEASSTRDLARVVHAFQSQRKNP